jgi:lipid-A-disaccharide synthase
VSGGPHIFLCAGEASSDRIAADCMAEIKERAPGARFSGFGGDRMVAAGLDQWYDLPKHSVMWVGQAIKLMPEIYGAIRNARRRLTADPADAFLLIDNPGINFFFAKTAKARGVPSIYYVGPQLWAYNPWRINKVRRWVDRMLVILPFERDYYRERGVDAAYVGNPLFRSLAQQPVDELKVAELRRAGGRLVGILPGSRGSEIARNLPIQLRAAERLAGLRDDVHFVVSCAKPKLAPAIKQELDQCLVPIPMVPASSGEIYTAADVVLATSGTVTLESVWYETPVVIVYKTPPLQWLMAKPWMCSDFIGLPNLLAGREIAPEFHIATDRSRDVAEAALTLLTDPRRRQYACDGLAEVKAKMLEVENPSAKAAEEVLATIAAAPAAGAAG